VNVGATEEDEEEEVTTASLPPELDGTPPVSGVFNLSDIGSALTAKEDDSVTSVATALQCVGDLHDQ